MRSSDRPRVANHDQEGPASSISTWAMRGYASKARPIRTACELHWKVSADDCAANRHADLDRGRRDRPSTGFHRIECRCANRLEREPILRACLRFPWPAGRSHQTVVVGWRRIMSVCKASGAWTLHLAEGGKWNRFAHPSPVIDAAGRHRLAPSNTHIHTGIVGIGRQPNTLEKYQIIV